MPLRTQPINRTNLILFGQALFRPINKLHRQKARCSANLDSFWLNLAQDAVLGRNRVTTSPVGTTESYPEAPQRIFNIGTHERDVEHPSFAARLEGPAFHAPHPINQAEPNTPHPHLAEATGQSPPRVP